jgi:hypothetical protein
LNKRATNSHNEPMVASSASMTFNNLVGGDLEPAGEVRTVAGFAGQAAAVLGGKNAFPETFS